VNTYWYKGLLYGLMLLLPGLANSADELHQIVIVKSSDNAYFNRSVETLINQLDQSIRFKTILVTDLTQDFDSGENNRLLVTLGQPAAEAVGRLHSGLPTLSAYLTREQSLDLQYRDQSAILLDQPLIRYLAFCKLLLSANTVGTIDANEITLNASQVALLDRLDFELKQYRIDASNKLLPVLRRLLRENDALLMLPRQAIYNRDTLKGILLTSYRNRKPVISYSPAHVKSGALASIYSSPTDIGKHLAQLINKKLQDPSFDIPAYEYARFYSITTNRRVARSLGIDLPAESDLRSALNGLEP